MSPLRSGENELCYYLNNEMAMPHNKRYRMNSPSSSSAASSPIAPYLPVVNRMTSMSNNNNDMNCTNQVDFLTELLDNSNSSPKDVNNGGRLPEEPFSNADNKCPDGTKHLTMPEIIEMLKNLAACKEKQYKWEQSVQSFASYPETDPNKNELQKIINLMETDKMTSKEKAIHLYEQLALKCSQFKNYIGAAKAYERAATLLFDISNPNIADEHEAETMAASTIRFLESAIKNYDAIHKYKHAGTLHYRCSCILRLIGGSSEEVEKHHIKALEYFTKPNHELKQRKRIDGLKISCYSSYSMARMTQLHNESDNFTTTTTTTTNTIKFHSNNSYHPDSDESDESNHSTSPPPSSAGSSQANSSKAKYFNENSYLFLEDNYFNDKSDSNDNLPTNKLPLKMLDRQLGKSKSHMINYRHQQQQQQQYMSTMNKEHHHHHHHANDTRHRLHSTASSLFAFAHKQHHNHKSTSSSSSSSYMANSTLTMKNAQRCIEDRIESARKLVKKLHKICPFYEVSMSGEDAGRVYCHICNRFLGAVSSTLKNHVNTQEHKQAYEDRQGQPLLHSLQQVPLQQQQQPQAQAPPPAAPYQLYHQPLLQQSTSQLPANNGTTINIPIHSINAGKTNQFNSTNGFLPSTSAQYPSTLQQTIENKQNESMNSLVVNKSMNSFLNYDNINVNDNNPTMLLQATNNGNDLIQNNGANDTNWNQSQSQATFDSNSNQARRNVDEQLFQHLYNSNNNNNDNNNNNINGNNNNSNKSHGKHGNNLEFSNNDDFSRDKLLVPMNQTSASLVANTGNSLIAFQ